MRIGEFEYLLLAAASRLGAEAYGASMRVEVEQSTGQSCSIGALYTTLDRLEKKGLVATSLSDPTPQRGGRPKRMVRLTGAGIDAATEFHRAITQASARTAWSRTAEAFA